MKMENKRGKVISAYWFVILLIVTAAIVYMASLFYGSPYDIRVLEEDILTNKIADCLAGGGYLKEGILDNETFSDNFLRECGLNFNVEEVYNWEEQGQYYARVNFYEFDKNIFEVGGKLPFEIAEGNINLAILSGVADSDSGRGRVFYALDEEGNSYAIKILSLIGKSEKNVK